MTRAACIALAVASLAAFQLGSAHPENNNGLAAEIDQVQATQGNHTVFLGNIETNLTLLDGDVANARSALEADHDGLAQDIASGQDALAMDHDGLAIDHDGLDDAVEAVQSDVDEALARISALEARLEETFEETSGLRLDAWADGWFAASGDPPAAPDSAIAFVEVERAGQPVGGLDPAAFVLINLLAPPDCPLEIDTVVNVHAGIYRIIYTPTDATCSAWPGGLFTFAIEVHHDGLTASEVLDISVP